MNVDPASVASAAILALYVTWEKVIPLISRRRNGELAAEAGGLCLGRAAVELQIRDAVNESVDNVIGPKIDAQTEVLKEIRQEFGETCEKVRQYIAEQRAAERERTEITFRRARR